MLHGVLTARDWLQYGNMSGITSLTRSVTKATILFICFFSAEPSHPSGKNRLYAIPESLSVSLHFGIPINLIVSDRRSSVNNNIYSFSFREGQVISYEGDRERDPMVQYALKCASPAVTPIENLNAYNEVAFLNLLQST